MSTAMDDRLDKARRQAQELHKKIDAARSKGDEAMRAEFAALSTRARELSGTVKQLAAEHRAEMRQGLNNAANSLHEAADHAKTAATEQQTRMREAGRAALSKAHAAVEKLTATMAAHRSTANSGKTPAQV